MTKITYKLKLPMSEISFKFMYFCNKLICTTVTNPKTVLGCESLKGSCLNLYLNLLKLSLD